MLTWFEAFVYLFNMKHYIDRFNGSIIIHGQN